MDAPAATRLSEIERQIVDRLVTDILAAGHAVGVWDGEGFELEQSTDKTAIVAAIGLSDETRLVVYSSPARDVTEALAGERGWVQLIHGNAADVISDYTMNLACVTLGAEALAERLGA